MTKEEYLKRLGALGREAIRGYEQAVLNQKRARAGLPPLNDHTIRPMAERVADHDRLNEEYRCPTPETTSGVSSAP